MNKLSKPILISDLDAAFEFAIKFQLDPKKGQSNRTSGMNRGLGDIVDNFLRGKIVETCITKMLKTLNSKKDYVLDFEVHKTGDADPDIIEIKDENTKRIPKIFIEIKNSQDRDRWIGLTEEQYSSIANSELTGGELKKAYIIYATIVNKNGNNEKKDDLLGIYLKNKIADTRLQSYSNLSDMYVEIKLILSIDHLSKEGIKFKKGELFLESDVFEVKDKIDSKAKPIILYNNKLPRYSYLRQYSYPKMYGDFVYSGNIKAYMKKNDKSSRCFIECMSDCTVKNDLLGTYYLEKGKKYLFKPSTVGRNPVLNRNNIWISRRKLKEQQEQEEILKILEHIARDI